MGEFQDAAGIAFDHFGNFIVADSKNSRLQVGVAVLAFGIDAVGIDGVVDGIDTAVPAPVIVVDGTATAVPATVIVVDGKATAVPATVIVVVPVIVVLVARGILRPFYSTSVIG